MLTEHHFGQIARRGGQLAAAQVQHRASLALEQDDVHMVGRCLAGLGAVTCAAGDYPQAASLLTAAWQRFDRVPPCLPPCDEAEYAQARTEVSAALAPALLAAAWAAGTTLAPASLLP